MIFLMRNSNKSAPNKTSQRDAVNCAPAGGVRTLYRKIIKIYGVGNCRKLT
jgi:hypothetical protein